VHCTSEELIETYYQGVPIKGDEIPQSFYTNAKAKRLLGYQPAHSWRDYVAP
jgi:nucleoside-diphosphate-sugar epimerase